MTAIFVSKFKALNPCIKCPKGRFSPKYPGRAMCVGHLTEARDKFRRRTKRRFIMGVCVSCPSASPRKRQRDQIRCTGCAETNRGRCLRWTRTHKIEQHDKWLERKKFADLGRCPRCREHRPLATGFKRCAPCRERTGRQGKGLPVPRIKKVRAWA